VHVLDWPTAARRALDQFPVRDLLLLLLKLLLRMLPAHVLIVQWMSRW